MISSSGARKFPGDGHRFSRVALLSVLLVGGFGYWGRNVYVPALQQIRWSARAGRRQELFSRPVILERNLNNKPVDLDPDVRCSTWADIGQASERPFDVVVLATHHRDQLLTCHRLLHKGLLGQGSKVVLQKPIADNSENAIAFRDFPGVEFFNNDHYVMKLENSPVSAIHCPEHLEKIEIDALESRQILPGDLSAHASEKGAGNWLGTHEFAIGIKAGGPIGNPEDFQILSKPVLRNYPWSRRVLGPIPSYWEFHVRIPTEHGGCELIGRAGKGQVHNRKLAKFHYRNRAPITLYLNTDPVSQVGHTVSFFEALAAGQGSRWALSLDEGIAIVQWLERIINDGLPVRRARRDLSTVVASPT